MSALDWLLPAACGGCGRAGALLCARCLESLRTASSPRDRFIAPDPGVVIGDRLEVALAAFSYEGALRRALATLKYSGTSRMSRILARQALPTLDRLLEVTGPATLVPVPIHRERLAVRGYNQAALLADELGSRRRLPVAHVLSRVRPTTKQHRLDRAARLRNLQQAFAAHRDPPGAVILVDDIITTSATLEACASVLRQAGCQAVYGWAVAREV